jgi:hypothetical protein
MQYGCGFCNNNHRIILSTYMIILPSSKTFSRNCRSRNLQFEQSHIRAIDFRTAGFEQFVFEQLHSSNLPRFYKDYNPILNQYKLGRKCYLKEYQYYVCDQDPDSLHCKALKRAKSLDELKIKSLAIIRLILILSQFF